MIQPSTIHGQGLFADRDYKKGEVICNVTGEKIPYREFHQKYGDDTTNAIKVMNWYYFVFKEEPYYSQNLIRYINEGSDPNVKYQAKKVICAQDISKGTELLLQYPKNYNRTYIIS